MTSPLVLPPSPPLIGESDPTAAPVGAPPPSDPADAPRQEREQAPGWAPRRWAAPDWVGLAAVTVTALVANTWRLSTNGLGNQYYAAATRSMITSWHNFWFVSFDPGGFISIDKPPVFLWVDATSARLFGVNSWSLLLPSALAGAGAVALLWCTVRRRFGPAAATIAGAVLALSPINVAVNRLNLPEPFLILLLVAAAWALLRSFDARRALVWVALAGLFVGLAFNTKMLAAYIPVPAFGLAVLVGTRGGWWPRLRAALVLGVVILATSLPWVLAVDATPAAHRPYVGGSADNTEWNLIFGYNGTGRVETNPNGRGAGGNAAINGAGGIIAGRAGPTRLWSNALGGQIAWLLPLAALGAVAAGWEHRRHQRRLAAIVLWTGWLVLFGAVFSLAGGTFHAYYTAAMAPGLAVLVGVGTTAAVRLGRVHRAWLVALGLAFVVTLAGEATLVARQPEFFGWVRPLTVLGVGAGVAVLAAAFVVALVARTAGRAGALATTGLVLGLVALLIAPTAWAASETAHPPLNATLPQAGPRAGVAGTSFGSASSNGDPALAAFLRAANRDHETWDLGVAGAQVGSGLLADQAIPVLSLGGFMGSDPAASVDSVAALVAAGRVRFFLPFTPATTSGTQAIGGPGGGGRGPFGGPFARPFARPFSGPFSGPFAGRFGGRFGGGGRPGAAPGQLGGAGTASARILAAVARTCTPVRADVDGVAVPAAYAGRIYDCQGRSGALAAAG